MEPIYPTQPETLIPAKYAQLIAELAAFESLFEMRLGVTINCGDIRLIRPVDGRYIVQELRRMKNGTAEYRHVSTHSDIAAAAIAFRTAVIGPSKPDTVELTRPPAQFQSLKHHEQTVNYSCKIPQTAHHDR